MDSGDIIGYDINQVFGFIIEICVFESIFYLSWSGECFIFVDEVFIDFVVLYVVECILGKIVFFMLWFKYYVKVFVFF